MSDALIHINTRDRLRQLLTSGTTPETFENILSLIGQHGLATEISTSGGAAAIQSTEYLFARLGGAESSINLNGLVTTLNHLRDSAEFLTIGLFKERLAPYVQADNRSVIAALNRIQHDRITDLINLMVSYVHKDIKHPVRTLGSCVKGSYSHVMDPEFSYSEAETGTYHTLLPSEESGSSIDTWSTYFEDTPLVRRYIRYIDSIASRHGIRLVYCPKTFDHLEEVDAVARPTWRNENGQIVRVTRATAYKALFVSLGFDYQAFKHLTTIETEVQPGQRLRDCDDMNYGPVLVEYLNGFVQVLTQLGAFSVCKIYYKGSRTPERL